MWFPTLFDYCLLQITDKGSDLDSEFLNNDIKIKLNEMAEDVCTLIRIYKKSDTECFDALYNYKKLSIIPLFIDKLCQKGIRFNLPRFYNHNLCLRPVSVSYKHYFTYIIYYSPFTEISTLLQCMWDLDEIFIKSIRYPKYVYITLPILSFETQNHSFTIISLITQQILKGHINAVEYLTKIKCCINERCSVYKQTPLFYAVDVNELKCVELLINAGADVNIPNYKGYTPLLVACTKKRKEIVKLLLKAGAKKDINNKIINKI